MIKLSLLVPLQCLGINAIHVMNSAVLVQIGNGSRNTEIRGLNFSIFQTTNYFIFRRFRLKTSFNLNPS